MKTRPPPRLSSVLPLPNTPTPPPTLPSSTPVLLAKTTTTGPHTPYDPGGVAWRGREVVEAGAAPPPPPPTTQGVGVGVAGVGAGVAGVGAGVAGVGVGVKGCEGTGPTTARECPDNTTTMTDNTSTITTITTLSTTSHPLPESDVPAIQLQVQPDDEDEDDDDAAVFLQLLGPNYAVSARSRGTSRPPPTASSRRSSRTGSAVSLAMSRQKSTRSLVSVATRVSQGGEGQLYRLLSAKRNHMQQLNSDLASLHARIKELEEQNRLLVRVGKRQEAALTRYHNMKSELPHILEAHKLEINVLQEKLRRANEEGRRGSERLKATEARLQKLTEEVIRLRELSKRRHLPERDILNQKLSAATLALQEKEKEAQELTRRVGVLDKAMKQQVQAEVSRHRTTSKKLFNLQRQHHQLQDTLKERETELEGLQQHLSRRAADSSSTTATSSRSGSLSARHKSGRKRGSGSSATSGIVSAQEPASASESRASLALEANGRLPPISGDGRRAGHEGGVLEAYTGNSPELHTRWTRHRTISSKEGVEERRTIRVKRRGRSPRGVGEDNVGGGDASITPSPATTPEPNARRSDPDGDALEDSATHPGHTDHRRRHRLAASLRDARQSQGGEDEEDRGPARPTMTREFSLIEHYPPRERVTLTGGSSGGSDSATSPPPARPVPPLTEPRPDSRPLRRDSPCPTAVKRHNTVTAADLRTFSSLSKLDSSLPPKPTRGAITP